MKKFISLTCVLLAACSSGSDTTDTVDNTPEPTGSPPGMVTDLEGIAYTDTEIEIFWRSATDPDGSVVGYTVQRDGTELVAGLDGLSFYDNDLGPEGSYTYSVTAIDNNGNQGTALEITINTPPAYQAVNQGNYTQLVRNVLEIFASQPMRASVNQPFTALDGRDPDTSSFNPDNSTITASYTCDNGGTAETMVLDASASGRQNVTFNNCLVAENLFAGTADFSRVEGSSTTREFSGYSVTDAAGESISIEGKVDQTNFVCRSDNYMSWQTTDFAWRSTSFSGTTSITDASTRFGAGTSCGDPWRANMSGQFTTQSPATGNKSVAVNVTADFESTVVDNTNFQSGSMVLTGTDNSSVTFNAANGDADSVEITLQTSEGTSSFSEPWSTWEGILIPRGTGL